MVQPYVPIATAVVALNAALSFGAPLLQPRDLSIPDNYAPVGRGLREALGLDRPKSPQNLNRRALSSYGTPPQSPLHNPTEGSSHNPPQSPLHNPTESSSHNPPESLLHHPLETQTENPTEGQQESPQESRRFTEQHLMNGGYTPPSTSSPQQNGHLEQTPADRISTSSSPVHQSHDASRLPASLLAYSQHNMGGPWEDIPLHEKSKPTASTTSTSKLSPIQKLHKGAVHEFWNSPINVGLTLMSTSASIASVYHAYNGRDVEELEDSDTPQGPEVILEKLD